MIYTRLTCFDLTIFWSLPLYTGRKHGPPQKNYMGLIYNELHSTELWLLFLLQLLIDAYYE